MRMRRDSEHAHPYLVDRVPGSFLVAAVLLLVLTIMDGVVSALCSWSRGARKRIRPWLIC